MRSVAVNAGQSAAVRPVLGVLGGMGPMATVDFLQRLYRRSSAARDQDQIPVLACIASTIPDRSAFLLGGGADPYPEMLRGMTWLRQGGAAAVAIPCNTAHYWADELERDSGLPIVHIVDAVADDLARADDPPRSVGLMATRGTLKADFYASRLAALGIRCVAPDAAIQRDIDTAIDLVKAGRRIEAESFALAAEGALIDQGVDALLLACTELPLALASAPPAVRPRIDSTDRLVAACIRRFSEGRQGEPQ
jgi:aspartate racemase